MDICCRLFGSTNAWLGSGQPLKKLRKRRFWTAKKLGSNSFVGLAQDFHVVSVLHVIPNKIPVPKTCVEKRQCCMRYEVEQAHIRQVI